jgi:hypothetical protein
MGFGVRKKLTFSIVCWQHCGSRAHGREKNAYKIVVGNPEGNRPGISRKIMLKRQGVRSWAGFMWFKRLPSGGQL